MSNLNKWVVGTKIAILSALFFLLVGLPVSFAASWLFVWLWNAGMDALGMERVSHSFAWLAWVVGVRAIAKSIELAGKILRG